jgi:hypothetical protein
MEKIADIEKKASDSITEEEYQQLIREAYLMSGFSSVSGGMHILCSYRANCLSATQLEIWN